MNIQNFSLDYQRFHADSRITAAIPVNASSKSSMTMVKNKKETPTKKLTIQRGSMMWDFVSESLLRQRYGPNLHTVQKNEKRWVFAVRAVNQKAFQPHQAGLKDESWALFLDYGKLKGRRKPVTSEEYTKLRSTFFNGIIRCACDGIISKVDRQTAAELGITLYKDYKYFMYEGEDLSKYQRDYPPYNQNASAFSQHNASEKFHEKRSRVKYPSHEKLQAEYEGPLPKGDYLFSVRIGNNGEVVDTKLLGAMPDDYNVNVAAMDVGYDFVNSKKMRFKRSDENNAHSKSNDQMYYSEPSQDSASSDSDLVNAKDSHDEITDLNNLIANQESTPIVVKLEPNDIVAPSDYEDDDEEECDKQSLEQIDYMNPSEREHYAFKQGFNSQNDVNCSQGDLITRENELQIDLDNDGMAPYHSKLPKTLSKERVNHGEITIS